MAGLKSSGGGAMAEQKLPASTRSGLVRRVIVFQLKLMVDGLRDVVLVPMALLAGLVGLLRGGEDPQREFRLVIGLGLRSERWIDLFGQHEEDVAGDGGGSGSMDTVVATIEQRLKNRYSGAGKGPDDGAGGDRQP
jgi:hypothetical protein